MGFEDGDPVGFEDGDPEGEEDGDSDGFEDGVAEGEEEGDPVGFEDGDSVGEGEGAGVTLRTVVPGTISAMPASMLPSANPASAICTPWSSTSALSPVKVATAE